MVIGDKVGSLDGEKVDGRNGTLVSFLDGEKVDEWLGPAADGANVGSCVGF